MRYRVTFDSPPIANDFVQFGARKAFRFWHPYIPDECLFTVGMVRDIPTKYSEEQFLAPINPETRQAITKIFRMHKKITHGENGQLLMFPTHYLKFFVKGNLPEENRIFGIFREVKRFIPPVLRCNKCLRYGHGYSSCEYEYRCDFCAGGHSGIICGFKDLC